MTPHTGGAPTDAPAGDAGVRAAAAARPPAYPRGDAAHRRPALTNPDKPLWPDVGLTKHDYAAYLLAVAPALLPHLRQRPLVLTRYPEGAGGPWFYQKNLPQGAPEWIETFTHRARGGRPIRYVLCHDERTLIWLAGQAAIEFHPWLATTAAPDLPDRMVIDLDPMAPATFEDARTLAAAVREILERAGLRGYPKTSGATGIHVFVPIAPRYTYRAVQAVVRGIGLALLRAWPGRVTLERAVSRRAGRVYVDYLQNAPGKTLVSAYAPRPLPGAPVSTPFPWDELAGIRPGDWSIRTVPARLRARGDPFAGVRDGGQELEPLAALLGVRS
jgi:bifunctional non-homologous end joining protein LigD